MTLTREEMIDKMVQSDIDDIVQSYLNEDDTEFLTRVLKGEGWTGYNQLTDKQIEQEYKDREFEEEQV